MKKYNDVNQNTGSTGCDINNVDISDDCLKTLAIPKPSQPELRKRWFKLMFNINDESEIGGWKMPQKMYDDAVNQLFTKAPSKDGSDAAGDCDTIEDSLGDVGPQKSSADSMAKAMGVTPCKTSYNNTEVEAAVAGIIFAGGASGSNTQTTSMGCEPVVIIDNINRTVTKNVSCLIQKTQAATNITSKSVNSISINKTKIKTAGDVNIGQGVSVKVLSKIDLTAGFVADIQNQLNAAATAQVAVAQSTNNKNGGVVSAGKMVQTNSTYFNSVNATKQISETLSNITMSVGADNILNINGSDFDIGGNLNINQTICFDIAAAMVVKATMGNIQKNIGEILTTIDSKTTQESSSTNEKSGLFDFLKNSFSFTNIIIMIIVLIVILSVIGAIVKFSSGTKPPPSSRPAVSSSNVPMGLKPAQSPLLAAASPRTPPVSSPTVPVGSSPKATSDRSSSFPFRIKRRRHGGR